MSNKKISLKKQLEILTDREDEAALDKLVEEYAGNSTEAIKRKLADAYMHIYQIWYYDIICHKISKGTEIAFIHSLLDLLDKTEKLQPKMSLFSGRGQCYLLLSSHEKTKKQKLFYNQKAIDQYQEWLKKSSGRNGVQDYVARALFNRLEITKDFKEIYFLEILELYSESLNNFDFRAFYSFLNTSFDILSLKFENKLHIHSLFLNRLTGLTTEKAQKNPLIYLEWSSSLISILDYQKENISDKYTQELYGISENLLLHLKDYKSSNHELLNKLGHAFHGLAKRVNSTYFDKKLDLYHQAYNFYMAGQDLQPKAWTFPVYATNVLKNMAELYYEKNDINSVIDTLAKGDSIFSKTENLLGEDFTLSLYWGRYLLDFAKLGYNFKNEKLLQESEKQLLISKIHGRGFYSQPFVSLAKAALKQNDKIKCIAILKECKDVFTTQYYNYEFNEVYADKDFEEIWQDLKAAELNW